jgi:Nuclease-related domain/Protein tyrosine and serine/threonine kinase
VSGQRRWYQERPSVYPWEQRGLDYVKRLLPDAEPYRAFATFTFTAKNGRVHEIDLLVATPNGLHLLELKAHPGTVRNKGRRWFFNDPELRRPRPIDNPLHSATTEATALRSRLQWAADQAKLGITVPRITAAVLLTGERLVSELDEQQALNVYGSDDLVEQTRLPGIWHDLLARPPADEALAAQVAACAPHLPNLMRAIGAQPVEQRLTVGRFELHNKLLVDGPTWQDFIGVDPSLPTDPRRIRIYYTRMQATTEERMRVARAAEREYLVLRAMSHPGIAQALDYQQLDQGAAILFGHWYEDQLLDRYVDTHGEHLDLVTRLSVVRQLAQALFYAHERQLYHRALSAHSVYVSARPDGSNPVPRITDWQVAARPMDPLAMTLSSSRDGAENRRGDEAMSMTSLSVARLDQPRIPYLAPEFGQNAAGGPAPLDLFGLGALSYLLLAGQAPHRAAGPRGGEDGSRSRDDGLRVPDSVPGTGEPIPPLLADLVAEATHPDAARRPPGVGDFLARLDQVDQAVSPLWHPAASD